MKIYLISRHNSQLLAGFSLIELLVVISIIGILAALLLANFVGVRERAADTRKKNDLTQMKKALRLYYNDASPQSYPASIPATGAVLTDAGGTTVYMKEVPAYKEYDVSTDGESFVLTVALENLSDQSITDSQNKCSQSIGAAGITLSNYATSTDFVVCED